MDNIARQNVKEVKWKAKKIKLDGINYAYNQNTKDVFDYDAYKEGQAIKIGHLEVEGNKYRLIPI